jgi:hypothetical protein
VYKGRGKLLQSESPAGRSDLHVRQRRVDTAAGANAAKDFVADGTCGGSYRQALFERCDLVFSCSASLIHSLDFGYNAAGLCAEARA